METRIFLILAAAILMCSPAKAEDFLAGKQVKLGDPVADFALQDLAGETVKLSDLKGKVVMLHFWSAQCPFVVRYEGRLQASAQDVRKTCCCSFKCFDAF